MMKRWGTEEWFSPTHACFAADLLTDCRNEFVRISVDLDQELEAAKHRSLCDFAASQASESVPASPRVDTEKAADRDSYIAAAAYAQWISDHIRQEAARCEREIAAARARSAVTSDELALLEHRIVPMDGDAPASEPPPFPEVVDLRVLFQRRRGRIDCECDVETWLSSAASAVSASNTASMIVLRQHIGLLLGWLDRSALRPLSGLSRHSDTDPA